MSYCWTCSLGFCTHGSEPQSHHPDVWTLESGRRLSKRGRRFGCSPWWPRSGLVRPGPLVPTRRLDAVCTMACDGRFLAPYRITRCRRTSVTRWQKPSITDLQIGRIHTLQAAAPRIPRALQGCMRTPCDLPIRVTFWLSFTPCPRHATRCPVVGKDRSSPTATCPHIPCSDMPGAHLGSSRPGCQFPNLP